MGPFSESLFLCQCGWVSVGVSRADWSLQCTSGEGLAAGGSQVQRLNQGTLKFPVQHAAQRKERERSLDPGLTVPMLKLCSLLALCLGVKVFPLALGCR